MPRVLSESFAGRAVAVFGQLAQVGGAFKENGRGPVIQMVLAGRGFGCRRGRDILLYGKEFLQNFSENRSIAFNQFTARYS